jgi:DNA processing protein
MEISLSDQEAGVLPDETGLDEIVNGNELPLHKVSATLLSLEMKRLVKQLPGQLFVRLNLAG